MREAKKMFKGRLRGRFPKKEDSEKKAKVNCLNIYYLFRELEKSTVT